jgi:hypothetical protein
LAVFTFAAMALTTPVFAAERIDDADTIVDVTLGGVDVMTEVICPFEARWIWVQFESNVGDLVLDGGTDGGSSAGLATLPLVADSLYDLRLPGTGFGSSRLRGNNQGDLADRPRVFLSSGTGATNVIIACMTSGS